MNIRSLPANQLAFLAGLAAALVLLGHSAAVILDDAYVYLHVVDNWLRLGTPVFNAGDDFSITTSPAWLLILGAGRVLLPGFDLVTVAKVLSLAFLGGAMALAWSLLKGLRGAVLLPFVIAFVPMMPTLLGHDTAFALFTGIGLIRSYVRADRWLGLWAAVFYLARGEGAILGGLLFAVVFVQALRRGDFWATLRRLLPATIAGTLLVVAWHGWYFSQFGSLLPATAKVKTLQAQAGWQTFAQGILAHLAPAYVPGRAMAWNLLAGLVCATGFMSLLRHAWPLAIWPVLHVATYVLLGVAYYHWYYYPVEIVLGLCLLIGSAQLIHLFVSGFLVRLPIANAAAVAGAAVALLAAQPGLQLAARWDRFDDSRFTAYVDLTEEMARRATGIANPVLLAHEIGIFGYRLPHFEVRDVVGLATPVKDVADFWNWAKQVERYAPDFLLWPFPDDAALRAYGPNAAGEVQLYFRVRAPAPGSPYELYTAERHFERVDPELAARARADATSLAALVQGAAEVTGKPEMIAVADGLALFAHAPSQFALRVPAGQRMLRIGFGYRNPAWAPPNAPDGATFRIEAELDNSERRLLAERRLDPVAVATDRGTQWLQLAVPETATTLHLSIAVGAHNAWDWTYWTAPSWSADAATDLARVSCPAAETIRSHLIAQSGGHIDELQTVEGQTRLRGWAADIVGKAPASGIVVVADAQVHCFEISLDRPDVAQAHAAPALQRSGFDVALRASSAGLRAYARLSGGRLAELEINAQ